MYRPEIRLLEEHLARLIASAEAERPALRWPAGDLSHNEAMALLAEHHGIGSYGKHCLKTKTHTDGTVEFEVCDSSYKSYEGKTRREALELLFAAERPATPPEQVQAAFVAAGDPNMAPGNQTQLSATTETTPVS